MITGGAMEKTEAKTALEELTMIMLYLSGFKENDRFSDSDLLLSWKGYNFDVLNKLDDEDYIRQGTRPSRSKSVYITQAITQAGIDKAKELMKKYGIEE